MPTIQVAQKSLVDMMYDSFDDLCHHFLSMSHNITSRRSIFSTEADHFGLALETCRPGGLVIALLGCDSAIVLRPKGNDYYLVVDAYYHGFMFGEAFLGPLPESIEYFRLEYEAEKALWNIFRNLETGTTQVGDPRLGPWPFPYWVAEEIAS